jgi:tetratricopeptide (TPR) repeat protein
MRAGVAIILLFAAWLQAADEKTAVREAMAAFRRGDRAAAQQSAREALRYLDALPAEERETPGARLLRLEALYLAGERAAADTLAGQFSSAAAGRALGSIGEFEQAEAILTRALAAAPGDFGVLYDLGIAASYAGHGERAREALEMALRQQPENADVLYSLAYVYAGLKQNEAAVRLLARAGRIAPERADIQKLLAITTGDIGAFADSLEAWNRYLKLAPDDDFARRERGYTAACTGRFEEGIAELEWFLSRHPEDAAGHFELGMALNESEPGKALEHFDRALALRPDFVEAHAARGAYLYRQGKPDEALADLEFAAARRPEDAVGLDRLGQAYLALDRTADAVRVLRKAAELAPDDSKIQLHFGRALADAGMAAKSKAVMERFRQLGPEKKPGMLAGLVDYLSLPPEQQRADYRARVEKAVAANPADVAAQLRHLGLLLEDGRWEEANTTARAILALKPDGPTLASAGRMMLDAGQYRLAAELLQPIQGADFFLAKALTLEASGKPAEALAACNRAIESPPPRAGFFQEAAALLSRAGQPESALRLLEQAPQSREILVMRSTTQELAGQSGDAARLLDQVQNRWPEWYPGWVVRGVILATHRRCDEARSALDTAVALGARSPEVRYFLDACGKDEAESAARRAMLFQTKRPQEW